MNRLRQGASRLFPATVGFLAGMAVMAVISMLFRAGEPERAPFAAPVAAHDAAPTVHPSAPVIRPAADPPKPPPAPPLLDSRPVVTGAAPPALLAAPPEATPEAMAERVDDLRQRRFDLPVQGISRAALRRTFADARGGGRHEALDVLAPRHTPVVAVEDGTIAKLFFSKAGGITVYQFDPAGQYAYYYAHLERYADGLAEGGAVRRGQVLGYVGTTGNAPADTPHLHFAIFRLTSEKRWWQGTPIDPFDVLR